MKITPLLIATCVLAIMAGCHKAQVSEEITAAEASIKATALASIAAKYPDVNPSGLKFSNLNIGPTPNGNQVIVVSYNLPASAKTTTEGKKVTTTTETIFVQLSLSGNVESIHKGTSSQTSNVAQ